MFMNKDNFIKFFLITFFLSFNNLFAFDDETFFQDIDTNYSIEDLDKNQYLVNEEKEKLSDSFTINGSISQQFVYGLNDTDSYFMRNKKGFDEISNLFLISLQGKPLDRLKIKISGISKLDWGQFKDGEFFFSGIKRSSLIKDAYLDYNGEKGLWARLGNQVIARGEVDSIISTDVINPRDLSRPGQSELDEIRKPVPALLISFPFKSTKIEFISTFEAGSNIIANDFEPFDQKILLNKENVGSSFLKPENNWESILRLKFLINGGNIDFTFGQVNWDQFSSMDTSINDKGELSVLYGFDRVNVAGLSGNLARSNFLFKYDFSYHEGRRLPKINNFFSPWEKYNLIISGIGFEYSGFSNLSIGGEINSNFIQNYSENLLNDKNEFGYMTQLRWSNLNELLNLSLIFNKNTGENSGIFSLGAEYDINDKLDFFSRVVLYNSNENTDFFFPYRDSDIIKLGLNYNF